MCIIGIINLKSKDIVIALINFTCDLMAIKVLINGIFMPMNIPNHLLMVISFKLMAIKIVNEFEHFTAISFFLHFIEPFN